MPTHNIDLTDHFADFVSAEIEAGRFSDVSEVICAGLSLLEERSKRRERKLAKLRALVEEGFAEIDRGLGIELNGEEEIAEFISQIGREVDAEVTSRSQKAS
jgi:antitoxin ParD1/3/4